MQGNKGKNTKPEMLVRARLRAAGLTGYRLQWKVPGRPDIAWPGKRVALFINGCFWHRHEGCPYATTPKSHVEYWVVKFDRNVERDERNRLEALREAGWTVHVIWDVSAEEEGHRRHHGRAASPVGRRAGQDAGGASMLCTHLRPLAEMLRLTLPFG